MVKAGAGNDTVRLRLGGFSMDVIVDETKDHEQPD